MGNKPVFGRLLEAFRKQHVEPRIDDNTDSGHSSDLNLNDAHLDSESVFEIREIAEKLKPKLEAENVKRMNAYWDFFQSHIREIQRTNLNMIGSELSNYDFFIDMSFRDIMQNKNIKIYNQALIDVDQTMLLPGSNLTYNPNSDIIGLLDKGIELDVFNPTLVDDLFNNYKKMYQISTDGTNIINAEGLYNAQILEKMNRDLNRGFAEVFNFHKNDGFETYVAVKLQFINDMCRYPKNTCIPEDYLQNLMLLNQFYDKITFITLSDNSIANVLFGIANMVMSDTQDNAIESIGSSFSKHRKKIDIDNPESIKKSVNVAFGPKKMDLLNKYSMYSGVSSFIREISDITSLFTSDPTALNIDDTTNFDKIGGINHPLAVTYSGDEFKDKQINFTLTTDNIEDFSGLQTIISNPNVDTIVCNFIENLGNTNWSQQIEQYAKNNGIQFNKIKKATDVITLELFENSIKNMFFDYGIQGIQYIGSELEKIKRIIDTNYDSAIINDEIKDDIKEKLIDLRYNLIEKYHDCNQYTKSASLFLRLLELDLKDIDNNYEGQILCSKLHTSGLWNLNPHMIAKIIQDVDTTENDDLKSPSYQIFTTNNLWPHREILSMSESVSSIYLINNRTFFNKIVSIFSNPNSAYDFMMRGYNGQTNEYIEKTIRDRTGNTERFLNTMN